MNTLISIIVPCYNQAQYMDECLQSVYDQTFINWECIIVNDGSPDYTEMVAKKWVTKDSRFKYLLKENGGLSSARNAGIRIAEGQWILPLDCDDLISSNYLELASMRFNMDNIKVIYAKAEKFGIENGTWKLAKFSLEQLAQGNLIYCTAFFRKKDWIAVGGYDEKMIYGLEDWEFWISILKNEGDVYFIDSVCFYYRTKEISMINELSEERLHLMYNYLSKKHTDFFIQYLGSFNYLNKEIRKLNYQRNMYKRAYESKRYKIGDVIVSILNKFKL